MLSHQPICPRPALLRRRNCYVVVTNCYVDLKSKSARPDARSSAQQTLSLDLKQPLSLPSTFSRNSGLGCEWNVLLTFSPCRRFLVQPPSASPRPTSPPLQTSAMHLMYSESTSSIPNYPHSQDFRGLLGENVPSGMGSVPFSVEPETDRLLPSSSPAIDDAGKRFAFFR